MLIANQYRQAVVVLGMHRSGTSALAGTAVRLGLAPPRTLLPTSDDNPSGFYESFPVVHVNHTILLAAGCGWNACLTFEPDRLDGMLVPADRQFILDTLRREFGDTGSFVLKDPRLCLTLPAWLPTLRATAASVRVLIVARHPVEVVRSLGIRNQRPETEAASHWLHHMLEAERASRGLNRAVVCYDDLMRDWRRCMAEAGRIADVAWPRPIELAAPDIDAFLAAAARHHEAAHASAVIGPAPVCDMINAAWIALRHLVSDPEAAVALACLDQVRARFADWRRASFRRGFGRYFRLRDGNDRERWQTTVSRPIGRDMLSHRSCPHCASEICVGTV